MASHTNVVLIDIEEEREYEEEYRRIVDLTQEDSDDERPAPAQHGRRFSRTQRNPPLYGHRSVLSYNIGGTTYRVGDLFELAQPFGQVWKAQFIEIKQVWVSIDEVLLRGLPYARNSSLYGRFSLDINEVCQVIEVDKDDDRPDEQQAMIQVRPAETLAIRDFHKTNADFRSGHNCRYGNDPFWRMLDMEQEQKKKYKREFAPLTCRWRMRCQYRNASFRRAARAPDTTVYHLLESDIDDPAYRISDEQRRREWLRRDPTPTGEQRLSSRYHFFDAFCGAGGASSGALQGGLKPIIAVDSWFTACDSYQRNFPNVVLFRQDISDFIARTELKGLPVIDVLHISPPCQYYSGAKVNEGKNDEKNEVALWACGDLIKKIRPRIFTMEQTFGLCSERFTLHFNKLIQCFTQYDYSVQWIERVELVQYGLPQNRKRLIIMGAAPGEQLPPWPLPTHGIGRKPLVTEAMAIGRLPRNVTLHDVQNARRVFGEARVPNVPLSRTIVCSGAQGLIHYGGERDYTLREFATLQGFPLNHEFVGTRTDIKKQIGNAYPASVAKVFFESIRKFLEQQDRNRMAAAARPGGPDSPAPIHSRVVDRRQTPHHHHGPGPGYNRLNGDLDEDEALQTAMRESRRERRRHQQPREVITITDSDEDDLPNGMDRLSVQPMSGNQCRTPPPPLPPPPHPPLSTASSFTLGNSPGPSPRPSPSARPRPSPNPEDSHPLNSSKRKSSDTLKPTPSKRTRDFDVINVDGDDNNNINNEGSSYYEANIADHSRAAAREEETASLPPLEDEGQPFTIRHRKWMGKLPMTRDRADNNWEF